MADEKFIKSWDEIPEREELLVKIHYRMKEIPWKIWNLTGLEMEAIEREKDSRLTELEKTKPEPKKVLFQGQMKPQIDDSKYQELLANWEKSVKDQKDKINRWYEFKVLEIGLCQCNGWQIEGETEQEKIDFVHKKVGAMWGALAVQIYKFSDIQDVNIQRF